MTLKTRVIPCLDVDEGRVVKGTSFVNLRDAGDPSELAYYYNQQGADELVFLDITASSSNRDTIVNVVKQVSANVFIPLTVGGGIRSVKDMHRMLNAGGDKVAVNTAAIRNPDLISHLAKEFGSQCVVLSVDVVRKKIQHQGDALTWQVYTHGGRVSADELDPIKWIQSAQNLGAGELLITSIDADGQQTGYDLQLIKTVSQTVEIPIIASGGAGKPQHLIDAIKSGADAVLIASILHFGEYSLIDIKQTLLQANIPVRIN